MCQVSVKKYFQDNFFWNCTSHPTSKSFQHSLMWKMTKQLTNSLHSCQTKKSQLWKLRTHDLKSILICINYAYSSLKRLLNHYSTQKHYADIVSLLDYSKDIKVYHDTFREVFQTISCSTFNVQGNVWKCLLHIFY